METDFKTFARIGFALLTFICLVLVLIGSRSIFLKMNFPPEKVNKRIFILALIFAGWVALVSLLSVKGILTNFSSFPPRIPFVTVPPLIAILLLTFNRKFQNFLLHIPPQWLIYLQTFRLPVEVFLLWLFLAHVLPKQMTFEGRNLDILSGISAPVFGWLCYGQNRNNQNLALFWNLAGQILLINIVTTAVLSLPTPLRYFMNNPDSSFVSTFPIVFLPTVLVPLAYCLHFFSLRKLYLEKKLSNQNLK